MSIDLSERFNLLSNRPLNLDAQHLQEIGDACHKWRKHHQWYAFFCVCSYDDDRIIRKLRNYPKHNSVFSARQAWHDLLNDYTKVDLSSPLEQCIRKIFELAFNISVPDVYLKSAAYLYDDEPTECIANEFFKPALQSLFGVDISNALRN